MDAAIERQLNSIKALKMSNSKLEAQLSQLADELQDKEKLVSCELCLAFFYYFRSVTNHETFGKQQLNTNYKECSRTA